MISTPIAMTASKGCLKGAAETDWAEAEGTGVPERLPPNERPPRRSTLVAFDAAWTCEPWMTLGEC